MSYVGSKVGLMDIIDEFLIQYKKDYDFYSELARIGSRIIENALANRGIKAIVSCRAKSLDRLRDKLNKRKEEKKYKQIYDIFDDIVDLAGVRISIYFPSDREIINEIVKELFEIRNTKEFPESSHKPKFSKRFSGYWATHYRVFLKKTDNEDERFLNTPFEIQVASVLMNAWAEVEHDLVYKPLSGKLSDDELALLDQINGLVISGEIALEQLQKAMMKRTRESKEITDKYELTNFIVSTLDKNYLEKLNLGNTANLRNYIDVFIDSKINTKDFIKLLNKVNKSEKETISDQLLNMLFFNYLREDPSSKSLNEYFLRIFDFNKDISGFEHFVKTWIITEKAVSEINLQNNKKHRKYFSPDFDEMVELQLLTMEEAEDLSHFRQIRNQLLHGIETPPDQYLDQAHNQLRILTEKIINQINDVKKRKYLLDELRKS